MQMNLDDIEMLLNNIIQLDVVGVYHHLNLICFFPFKELETILSQ